MLAVPAGEFWMGSDEADADPLVKPRRKIKLALFYIDRCEVTNQDYARFNPKFQFPEGQERHPVTHLTREQAQAYLKTLGKRLPTAAEWEKAARGPDGRRYPWGNDWDESKGHLGRGNLHKVCGLGRLKPVGSYPQGASPYGCLDMCGNAWEWVSDDLPGTQKREMIKGGAYGYREHYCRSYAYATEDEGMT